MIIEETALVLEGGEVVSADLIIAADGARVRNSKGFTFTFG